MKRKGDHEIARIGTKRVRFFRGVLCRFVAPLLAVFIIASGAAAQTVYTPEKGSPERKAILDALRIPVEKELKQKIVFNIENFNVLGNWAFISGDPQNTSGGRPDYGDPAEAEMFDNNFSALLKKTGGKWKVVTYALRCTDVCDATWWRDYKAPKAIFPYTE